MKNFGFCERLVFGLQKRKEENNNEKRKESQNGRKRDESTCADPAFPAVDSFLF